MNNIGKPNLEIFADTLLDQAKINQDILVVTSDSRGSGKLVNFGKELPVVYRWPYDFSVPGIDREYIPQHIAPSEVPTAKVEKT